MGPANIINVIGSPDGVITAARQKMPTIAYAPGAEQDAWRDDVDELEEDQQHRHQEPDPEREDHQTRRG